MVFHFRCIWLKTHSHHRNYQYSITWNWNSITRLKTTAEVFNALIRETVCHRCTKMPLKHRKKKQHNIRAGWSPAQAHKIWPKLAGWSPVQTSEKHFVGILTLGPNDAQNRGTEKLQKNTRGSSEFWCRKTRGPGFASSAAWIFCVRSVFLEQNHPYESIKDVSAHCWPPSRGHVSIGIVGSYKLQICQQLL